MARRIAGMVFLVLLAWFIHQVIGGLFFEILTSEFGDLKKAGAYNEIPGIFFKILIAQSMGTLAGFIVLPLIYLRYINVELNREIFTLRTSYVWSFIGLAAILFVVLMPLVELSSFWNQQLHFPEALSGLEQGMRSMEEQAGTLTNVIINYQNPGELFLVWLVVALLPAISEELVFRGILQGEITFITRKPHLAIWISAFLFATIHLQFFSFLPRLLLGGVLGYLYYFSGNILVNVFFHFINNAISIYLMHEVAAGHLNEKVESGEGMPISLILISTCLSVIGFFIAYKLSKMRQARSLNREE